ncbi:hypothetical protein EV189_3872 [Motilibacter rhizosphaerae]|uniref:Dienelactone hydrolase n=1 Tax=Motilibacter rhizosphaerae TaxID=598652 RepID=A0A4Q7N9Z4_9ACTN|nr:hypothetical protein [Motilibacter rhizosphaerae]RZS79002.1 hypothetical protein EV189_3872 [Motilibacter rhizosphaerae]
MVLFHHAQGLTRGVHALADALRAGGAQVTTPDLYAGRTFATLEDGVAHAEELGSEEVLARGTAAAPERPAVYVGVSLGALPAQALAQTRPDALGAVLVSYPCDGHLFVDSGLAAFVPGQHRPAAAARTRLPRPAVTSPQSVRARRMRSGRPSGS